MAENYEGEATGYPSEVELETEETPSPNFVVTLNSLAGAPRLVDGDGNDFPTDDATGVITIDTGGDSGNTVHYTVQTPTAPEKLIARTNIGVGQADSPAIEALRLNSDGSYVTPDGNVNTSISTDNAQHRTLMLGVNRELAAGGAGTVLDATRGGWSFNLELDYLAQDMTTFEGHGTLQNEFYIETAGSERVFLGGYSASVPVTVDSVTDIGANVLVTLNAASLAATGLSNYLQKGMRFYFTTVNGGSGIAINTPYRVFSVESSNTFHLATSAETLTAMTAGSMTSGVMNRGGWGQVGFYYPVGVISASYQGAQSGQTHLTEPLFFVRNTKETHHAELAILNAAADSHQAYINFDDKWRAGNGAIYGNLSTSFDISNVDFGTLVAWSMNNTTGHVKMGYNSDAFTVAPLSMLDVNGTVTATAFVGDGSGLTGIGGVPTTITVANEATDTTCFPLFVTAATGDLGPKTNAGMAFNSATGQLTLNGNLLSDTVETNSVYVTSAIALGDVSDTTLTRLSAGQMAIEGVQVATATNNIALAKASLALGGATIGSNALAIATNPVLLATEGASSTAAFLLTGTPFDGTATTSVPLIAWMQTGAAASTTWGTSGTLLGGKYTAGYAGDWINFKASNDASVFLVANSGAVTTGGTITSGISLLAASGSFLGFNGSSLISTGGTNGNFKFQNSSAANAFMLSGDSSNALMKVGATAGNRDGWMQWAGQAYIDANGTNATGTLATTGLSVTLVAGRKYSFKLILYVANSLAADGVKIDFDGGTATATNFRAHATVFDTALLLSSQVSALATDIAQATCTGDSMIEVHGSITVNAGGTFIPRYAGNTAVSGTLTLYRGSHLLMWDMP